MVCPCLTWHQLAQPTADGAGEAREDNADDELASFIDAGAAMEMARFGLSRKQTAALDLAQVRSTLGIP